MKMMEFGPQNGEVVVLLHGGGLSWWNYREAAKYLAHCCHVVIPVLDGHADSGASFTGLEENAARLLSEIDLRFGGRVAAIGGLSLGGQIALEMLSQRTDICRYALIESALVKPMKLTHALIGPSFGMSYGLVKQKWFSRAQAAYLRIPEEMFADYYRDTCKISKTDMIAFLKAGCMYRMKPALGTVSAKVQIVAGSREQKNILESAAMLHRTIPDSRLEILHDLHHGDLSINHPRQYARMLLEGIGGCADG